MKPFRSSLAVLSLLAVAWAQAPAADEEALRILDRAARFQRGDDPRPAASSFHGLFFVTVHDDDGTFSADIERWYTRDPERMLTRSEESVTGTRSSVGYDEGEAWFRNDKTGEVRVYSDRPDLYDVDLAKLDEQLRITRLLVDAIAMDSLIPRLTNLRVVGEGAVTDLDGVEHPVDYVRATLEDPVFADESAGDDAIALRFAIGRDGALRKLDVDAPPRPRMSLIFGFHGETEDGLRVPLNIKVSEMSPQGPVERVDLGVFEDDEGHAQLELDVDVDPARFEVPRD